MELVELREAAARTLDPRAPRSITQPSCKQLASIRGVRRQLVQLFREAKAGLIEPTLFAQLTRCLRAVAAIDDGKLVEERLERIEAALAAAQPARPRGDGSWPPPSSYSAKGLPQ